MLLDRSVTNPKKRNWNDTAKTVQTHVQNCLIVAYVVKMLRTCPSPFFNGKRLVLPLLTTQRPLQKKTLRFGRGVNTLVP